MSAPPALRRTDKSMTEAAIDALLARAYSLRLGSVGADGWPYVCPLLFVWQKDEIRVHNTSAAGHLKRNAGHDARVCVEIDEPGEVFAYGRFECDSSVAYSSIVAYGRIRIEEDRPRKAAFYDALLAKYSKAEGRPKGFYPRLDQTTVYSITLERISGKENILPVPEQQWPALDRTMTPDAKPGPGTS
jgi:nitroimidazol reductase NimA-like FMN-containing flavoprotein (pyridoxamine 5'-phosphate oxidase superfamily)